MSEKHALFSLDYPPERGGVARYLGDLVEASGGTMDVFVPETHACTGPGRVETLRTFASGPSPWRPLVRSLRGLRARGYRSLLVSHLLPVGTAALLARFGGGLPYAVLIHGLDLRLAMARRHRRWLARLVMRQAGAVFVNSEAVAAEVRALDAGLRPIVVTPGVTPRAFPGRAEARAGLGVPDAAFLCVTVARLVPRKGIDAMIRALPALPASVRYVVIGEGADGDRLRALAEASGVTGRVTFLSGVEDPVRDRWLAAADLFVFLARDEPNDLEGFGLACLEASLAGLPILAGRSGGVPEAVAEGETGLLVDVTDESSLTEAFSRLFSDPALRARLGRQGRERALRAFRWDDRWQRVRSTLSRL